MKPENAEIINEMLDTNSVISSSISLLTLFSNSPAVEIKKPKKWNSIDPNAKTRCRCSHDENYLFFAFVIIKCMN